MDELTIGREYTKEEIEQIFNTNFGARIKGITLRRDTNGKSIVLLFSRADGPYTDNIVGDTFYYDGEGTNKDQDLTAANKALITSNEVGRDIFGFRQEAGSAAWKYLGLLEVLDYAYIKKRGFMTYEFHLRAQPVSPKEIEKAESVIDNISLDPPQLTEASKMRTARIAERDAAFRRNVKMLYDNTCVVCKKKRISASGYPEVEAAHIYPREKLGANDYRNGIALCKLHHWAFDNGLLAISDGKEVLVKSEIIDDDNYEEITRYRGLRIASPNKVAYGPDALFLRSHRELHGF